MHLRKTVLALGTVGAFALPTVAVAQPVPSYATQAAPGYASHDEQQIHGTVASLDGKYRVYVRDDRGYVDTVDLHDGTVINPTGLPLQPGMPVTIYGRPNGKAFDANEIDAPNDVSDDGGQAADYGYDAGPDAGYVTPYPYYSYYPAYALSYPAFISLGFGFGGGYYGGGYYGGYGRGYYGRGGYYGHGGGYRGSFGPGYGGHGTYSAGGSRGSYGGGYRGSAGVGRSSGGFSHAGGGAHH